MVTTDSWLQRLKYLPLSERIKSNELNTVTNTGHNNGWDRVAIVKLYNTVLNKAQTTRGAPSHN